MRSDDKAWLLIYLGIVLVVTSLSLWSFTESGKDFYGHALDTIYEKYQPSTEPEPTTGITFEIITDVFRWTEEKQLTLPFQTESITYLLKDKDDTIAYKHFVPTEQTDTGVHWTIGAYPTDSINPLLDYSFEARTAEGQLVHTGTILAIPERIPTVQHDDIPISVALGETTTPLPISGRISGNVILYNVNNIRIIEGQTYTHTYEDTTFLLGPNTITFTGEITIHTTATQLADGTIRIDITSGEKSPTLKNVRLSYRLPQTPVEIRDKDQKAYTKYEVKGETIEIITDLSTQTFYIVPTFSARGGVSFSQQFFTPQNGRDYPDLALDLDFRDQERYLLATGQVGSTPLTDFYYLTEQGNLQQQPWLNLPPAMDLDYASQALADINGDGLLDLLITGRDSSLPAPVFRIFTLNLPTLQFVQLGPDQAGIFQGDLSVADLNNDGSAEIILTGDDGTGATLTYVYSWQRNTNQLLLNNALTNQLVSLMLANWGSGLTGGAKRGSIIVTDFDNDGDKDLYITGITDESVNPSLSEDGLFINDLFRPGGTPTIGGSVLFPTITTSVNPLGYGKAVSGDVNNDGLQDIVSIGATPTGTVETAVLINTYATGTSVTFQKIQGIGITSPPGVTPPSGKIESSLDLIDVDGDGYLDLYTVGNRGLTPTGQNQPWPTADFHYNLGSTNPGIFSLDQTVSVQLDPLNVIRGDIVATIDEFGHQFVSIAGCQSQCFPAPIMVNGPSIGPITGNAIASLTGNQVAGEVTVFGAFRADLPTNTVPTPVPTASISVNPYDTSLGGYLITWNPTTDQETPQSQLRYHVMVGSAPYLDDIVSGEVPSHGGTAQYAPNAGTNTWYFLRWDPSLGTPPPSSQLWVTIIVYDAQGESMESNLCEETLPLGVITLVKSYRCQANGPTLNVGTDLYFGGRVLEEIEGTTSIGVQMMPGPGTANVYGPGTIRNFNTGIQLQGDIGPANDVNKVFDMNLISNQFIGIDVSGSHNLIRRTNLEGVLSNDVGIHLGPAVTNTFVDQTIFRNHDTGVLIEASPILPNVNSIGPLYFPHPFNDYSTAGPGGTPVLPFNAFGDQNMPNNRGIHLTSSSSNNLIWQNFFLDSLLTHVQDDAAPGTNTYSMDVSNTLQGFTGFVGNFYPDIFQNPPSSMPTPSTITQWALALIQNPAVDYYDKDGNFFADVGIDRPHDSLQPRILGGVQDFNPFATLTNANPRILQPLPDPFASLMPGQCAQPQDLDNYFISPDEELLSYSTLLQQGITATINAVTNEITFCADAAATTGSYTASVIAMEASGQSIQQTTTLSVVVQTICGASISSNYILTQDWTCQGNGPTLSGDNIVFDGNGFSISYAGGGTSPVMGITVQGNGITVQGLTLLGFDQGAVVQGDFVTIDSSTVASSSQYGVLVQSADGTVLSDLILTNNDVGARIDQSQNTIIRSPQTQALISGSSTGIELIGSIGTTITQQTIQSNTRGVYLFGSTTTTLSQSIVQNNPTGVVVEDSFTTLFDANTFQNHEYGVDIRGSTITDDVTFTQNTFMNAQSSTAQPYHVTGSGTLANINFYRAVTANIGNQWDFIAGQPGCLSAQSCTYSEYPVSDRNGDFYADTGVVPLTPSSPKLNPNAGDITSFINLPAQTIMLYPFTMLTNIPPQVTSAPPANVQSGQPWTYQLTVLDYDDLNGPFTAATSDPQVTITSGAAPTDFTVTYPSQNYVAGSPPTTFTIRIQDPYSPPAAVTQQISFVVTAPGSPTQTQNIPDLIWNEDTTATLDLSNYFLSSQPITYSIGQSPPPEIVSTFNQNILTLTPTQHYYTQSPVSITVLATNTNGQTESNLFALQIRPINDPPRINSLPPLSALVTQNWTYNMTVTDPDNTAQELEFNYTLSISPNNFSFDPDYSLSPEEFKFTFTPDGNDYLLSQNVDFVITVNDSFEATDQQIFTLTLQLPAYPVFAGQIQNITLTEGDNYSLDLSPHFISTLPLTYDVCDPLYGSCIALQNVTTNITTSILNLTPDENYITPSLSPLFATYAINSQGSAKSNDIALRIANTPDDLHIQTISNFSFQTDQQYQLDMKTLVFEPDLEDWNCTEINNDTRLTITFDNVTDIFTLSSVNNHVGNAYFLARCADSHSSDLSNNVTVGLAAKPSTNDVGGGGSGGSGGSGGTINPYIPPTPTISPPATSPDPAPDPDPPTYGIPHSGSSLIYGQNNVVCAPDNVIITESQQDVLSLLPTAYQAIGNPLTLQCVAGSSVDLSFAVPVNYTNVSLYSCADGQCIQRTVQSQSGYSCGDQSILIDPSQFPTSLDPFSVTPLLEGEQFQTGLYTIKLHTLNANITSTSTAITPPYDYFVLAGTPITITGAETSEFDFIQVPYVTREDMDASTVQLYIQDERDWHLLDVPSENGFFSIDQETLSTLQLQGTRFVLAPFAHLCPGCDNPHLELQYQSAYPLKSVILIHGLASKPMAWNNALLEFTATKAPYNVYTFGYSSGLTSQTIIDALIRDLQSIYDQQQDRPMVIVAHSLGGLLIRQALDQATNGELPFLQGLERVILVGTPNQGVPDALLEELRKSTSFGSIFSLNDELQTILREGYSETPDRSLPYFSIVGTVPLNFLGTSIASHFNEDNDGLVDRTGATTLGKIILDDYCINYLDVPANHIKLIKDNNSLYAIQQLLAKDNEAILLGRHSFVKVTVPNCEPGQTVVLAGVPNSLDSILDKTGCLSLAFEDPSSFGIFPLIALVGLFSILAGGLGLYLVHRKQPEPVVEHTQPVVKKKPSQRDLWPELSQPAKPLNPDQRIAALGSVARASAPDLNKLRSIAAPSKPLKHPSVASLKVIAHPPKPTLTPLQSQLAAIDEKLSKLPDKKAASSRAYRLDIAVLDHLSKPKNKLK